MIHFDLLLMQEKVEDIQRKMLDDNFWNDRKKAQALIDEMNEKKDTIEGYAWFKQKLAQMLDDSQLLKEEFDFDILNLNFETRGISCSKTSFASPHRNTSG